MWRCDPGADDRKSVKESIEEADELSYAVPNEESNGLSHPASHLRAEPESHEAPDGVSHAEPNKSAVPLAHVYPDVDAVDFFSTFV